MSVGFKLMGNRCIMIDYKNRSFVFGLVYWITIGFTCLNFEVATFASHMEGGDVSISMNYNQFYLGLKDRVLKEKLDRRLVMINEITEKLKRGQKQLKRKSLNGVLGASLGLSNNVLGAISKNKIKTESGLSILYNYERDFNSMINIGGLSEKNRVLVEEYFSSKIDEASNQIWKRCKVASAGNNASKFAAFQFGLVIPFLAINDSDWDSKQIEKFPRWVKNGSNIKILEKIALDYQRIFTAYQLSLNITSKAGKPSRKGYIKYLRNIALDASKNKNHKIFMLCMQTAIDIAKDAKREKNVTSLIFQMAEGLNKMGKPADAAISVKNIWENTDDNKDYIKSLLLYLRYEFDAKKYETLITEVPRFRDDKRMEPYIPRMDYIVWVSHGRLGNKETASKISKKFWADFPDHTLGADMYYSIAMEALAKSDTKEALRLFDIIVYKYPESRLIKIITGIQLKIRKSE